MNDYERIARIIRYLDEHQAEQPSLDVLAREAGLSVFHFHRLFTNWAGITPKDFLQLLTLAHVRSRLRRGENVLQTSLDVGLSGPGRLHDLCVTLEAASPGELKSGGEGWTIRYGTAETPFGRCVLAESPRGICHLSFLDESDESTALSTLQTDWPKAKFVRDDARAAGVATSIFAPSPDAKKQPLRAYVRGTAFQVRVWRALLNIPAGKLVSYGQLAQDLGAPQAARAVGSAVGKNPIGYLIPCHRVIRETGVIGDYRWGRIRKRAAIAWETSPLNCSRDY